MESMIQELLRHRGPDGSALPSVRGMARQFDRSPQTIQKALKILKARGDIHSLPRKGCYWGAIPKAPAAADRRVDLVAKARERLLSDLRCGAYHPHRELPAQQSLSQIYGVSPSRIGQILDGFVETGILERRGRFHAPAQPISPPRHGTVLLAERYELPVLELRTEDGELYAQSRKRIITPEQDNFGFAAWVQEHKDTLA